MIKLYWNYVIITLVCHSLVNMSSVSTPLQIIDLFEVPTEYSKDSIVVFTRRNIPRY